MWFTVGFVTILILLIYEFVTKRYSYWSKRGINGPTPIPPFGSIKEVFLMKKSLNAYFKSVYQQYSEDKVVGLYRGFTPMLLVRDPEIIKQVFIKDFNSFHNRSFVTSTPRFSKNLFNAQGETWKLMRQKLTPVFTSKKLKTLMPLIKQSVDKFIKHTEWLVNKNQDLELRNLTAKYTLDTIASCAFGLDVDVYNESKNEFSEMAAKVFNPPLIRRVWNLLELIIPGIRSKLGIVSGGLSDVHKFFIKLVKEIIEQRGGKPSDRKDFMDLMIELKEQGKISRRDENYTAEVEIDDDMIVAQALVFYLAGFEGPSATISFLLHELALNQDIQASLYNEICSIIEKHGDLTFESMSDMTYMHVVINESLRKASTGGVLFRTATSDCFIPEINLTIEKGTNVIISVSGLHSDPKYYANPTDFNPENLKDIPQTVFLPFGIGPRNCIGIRFAEMQIAMCIAGFLRHFKVTPSEKTKKHLDIRPTTIFLTSLHGIWVKISKR